MTFYLCLCLSLDVNPCIYMYITMSFHLLSTFQCELAIPYDKKQIPAKVLHPQSAVHSGTGLIITHGAGGDMDTAQIVQLARTFAAAGYLALRFTCRGNIDHRIKVYATVLVRITFN